MVRCGRRSIIDFFYNSSYQQDVSLCFGSQLDILQIGATVKIQSTVTSTSK